MSAASPAIDVMFRIGRTALWAPLAVIIGHALAGGWWGHEPYVDPVSHFLGGAAAAFFFWRAGMCARTWMGNLTPLALGLLAFGLASAAAVLWELHEFLLDWYFGTYMQRSLANTMRDLVLGLGGAATTVGLFWVRRTRITSGSR